MRLVYLAPVPWSSFAQRPHFMARYLLNNGFSEVVWVDPYPARLPQWTDLFRSWSLHDQGTPLEKNLQVIKPNFLPIDPLPFGFQINKNIFDHKIVNKLIALILENKSVVGIGKPSGLASYLLNHVDIKQSFYDAMDDFPAVHTGFSRLSMQKNEEIISAKVKNLFCSSDNLMAKFSQIDNKFLIENAFDEKIIPENYARCKKNNQKPIIGYIGSLGKWFDWNLLRKLAKISLNCEFHLIGPKLVPVPLNLPSNIKLFPACRHDKVPEYLEKFDVGLIPFVKNQLTNSVDPVKYYEYKAMGIPVLTSSFGQMKKRVSEPGVFFAENESVELSFKAALEFQYDQQELKLWREKNNWSARFQVINTALSGSSTR